MRNTEINKRAITFFRSKWKQHSQGSNFEKTPRTDADPSGYSKRKGTITSQQATSLMFGCKEIIQITKYNIIPISGDQHSVALINSLDEVVFF